MKRYYNKIEGFKKDFLAAAFFAFGEEEFRGSSLPIKNRGL